MLSNSQARTYSLQDLDGWTFEGVSLAVVGHPVRHSISPQMHNAAIAQLATDAPALERWRYFRFDIEAERLADALPLFHEKGFLGLNLTVPHKEVAFSLIQQIAPQAHRIGAVNTLKREGDAYVGFNTDGYGLSNGIRETLDTALAGSHVVLLGAGGAARAAAVQCIDEGCQSLTIVNRNQDRLDRLLASIQPFAAEQSVPVTGVTPDRLTRIDQHAILINATSLGLKDSDDSPFPPSVTTVPSRCYDMIYNPPSTPLMRLVEQHGGRSANGLSMLVHQGARSLEIWTGRSPSVPTMRHAALDALEG